MWSSPACGLKQYNAQASPKEANLCTDEAEGATDNYAEQQEIEPGELELFKCVEVEYMTLIEAVMSLAIELRRIHLSSVQPYRAGPKAGELDPEGALKLEPSGAHSKDLSGGLLGPASPALGPAL